MRQRCSRDQRAPLFHVADAAVAIATIPIPDLTIQLSTIALSVALDGSLRQFAKYQTNKYLERANEQIFEKRGLYAMIMTFEPTSMNVNEAIDVNTHVGHTVGHTVGSEVRTHRSNRFRTSSGTTRGRLRLPEAAPLVFPDLSELPEYQGASRMNKTGFFNDYLDRRAQAKFDGPNPGSKLAAPPPRFLSEWSDPNSSVSGTYRLRNMLGGSNRGDRGTGASLCAKHTERPERQGAIKNSYTPTSYI